MRANAYNILLLLMSIILVGCLHNSPPIADAGSDKTLYAGDDLFVALSAEASFDPNGDPLNYHWSIESLPIGSDASIANINLSDTSISIDKLGVYKISLIVDDGEQRSPKDILTIRYIEDDLNDLSPIDGRHPKLTAECIFCHNGIIAVPKSVNHLMTNDNCIACHTLIGWTPPYSVNHLQVIGSCESCHNGTIATGKPVTHPDTGNNCSQCHPVLMWTDPIIQPPNGMFDHQGIEENCINCHDGLLAAGKNSVHFPSSNKCEACHSINAFVPVTSVDHGQVLGACSSCHNNIVAMGESPLHITSSDNCEACHAITTWRPVIVVDHNEIIGTCETCHISPESHDLVGIITECDSCHSAITWLDPIQVLPTPINN